MDDSNVLGGQAGPPVVYITVDEAMERVGVGKFQTKIVLAAGLCFAADAMEILLLSVWPTW